MNSFGKIVESVRFLSPDGRFLTSRVEAIKYMLKDGSASLDDMERMRLGLLKDGWESMMSALYNLQSQSIVSN